MKSKALAAPYLVWTVIFVIVPLLIVVYFAFTDASGSFTLDNFLQIDGYMPTFLNSVFLAAIATVICLVLAYPFAYVLASLGERAQKFLIMLVMLPMCMSFLLRTMAWVSLLSDNGILNNFLASIGLGRLNMLYTPGAVILGMVYDYIPYMIMPLYTALSKFDRSMLEAADDLGATKRQTFSRVVLPLTVPAIISGVTMVFVPAVSTFYISEKLGGQSTAMIGDIIEAQFKTAYNPYFGAALSLCLMVLVLICTAVMRRFSDEEEEEEIKL